MQEIEDDAVNIGRACCRTIKFLSFEENCRVRVNGGTPMCAVRIETLKALEPIASLPEARLNELVGLCRTETASKDSDPFLARGVEGQVVYLVRGS